MNLKLPSLLRELIDLLWLVFVAARDRREIVVYSEDISSYSHFEDVVRELTDTHGLHVVYVTSDPRDPLFHNHSERLRVLHIRALLSVFMRLVEAKVFITTMPDLGKLHIPRPSKGTRLVYIFHAIISTHMVYRPGAFDHYDTIFCVGPHHVEELLQQSEVDGVPQRTLVDFGYPKLDRLAESFRSYTKRRTDVPTVLVAPSWGESNILKDFGEGVIGNLLDAGYRVIVRPHPQFSRRSPDMLRGLRARFGHHQAFTLEPNINSVDSLLEADLMICDWSGVAYEYAFATERPVLSIDLPRKVNDPEWQRLGIVPFEDFARGSIGRVIGPHEVGYIEQHVAQLLDRREEFRDSIRELRSKYIYNFGSAGRVGAKYIYDIVRGGE